MNNQSFLIFLFPTFLDLLPHLIFAGVFIGLGAFVTLIRYEKNRQGDVRAEIEPLCVWQYSAAEWRKYTELYDLAKFPNGAARVQITLLDIWIIDDGRVRRTILDDDRKCVTACSFANQMLKIRVRSWACPYRYGSVHYSVQDVHLPVPAGMEWDAIELARLFNENISRQNKKVVSVTPDDSLSVLMPETDF